jgi:hypothetical protein
MLTLSSRARFFVQDFFKGQPRQLPMIARVGEAGYGAFGIETEVFLRLLNHWVELTEVVAVLGNFTCDHEVMLVINCGLDVVADGGLASFAELAAVRTL